MFHKRNANTPSPPCEKLQKDEDIVHAISNDGFIDSDVDSSHPGAGEGSKGWAVRPLKRYVSWVQNVVRQFGLLSAVGIEN